MYLMSLTVASPSVDCVLLVFQKATPSWCDLGSAGSQRKLVQRRGLLRSQLHMRRYFKIRGSLKNWETLPFVLHCF